jgi:hypothetical protein
VFVSVTCRGDPHFLDIWLADCGEVVTLTLRSRFSPQEDSWYSFVLEAE